MSVKEIDKLFMNQALKEARKAAKRLEVPVGAIIVHKGLVVSRGFNRRETGADPTAHAEMLAIKAASRRLGSWRLSETTLYVTLEPCLMCMGAIIQARVGRLVFGALDPKAGACGSLYDLSTDKRLNHRVHVTSAVCEAESEALLKSFFADLRARKKEARKKTL